MRDIAEATGVSQSTVSRVLSGTPTAVPIAEATRRRVTETADRLGYRPNPLARGLRGSPTMLLGVIVRDITDPFFAGAIEAASLEANRRGYNVVLGHAHQSADEAVALWGILEARHCDAILFLGDMRDRPELIEELKGTRIPVAALWHGARGSGIPTVSVDNEAGMAAVMNHVVSLGHRRIAFAGPKRLGDITEREDRLPGLAAAPWPRCAPGVHPGGRQRLRGRRGGAGRADGAEPASDRHRGATDVLAMGMLHAAYRRGLRVPDDVSVSGFDDIPVAAVSVPTLTTVRMPTESHDRARHRARLRGLAVPMPMCHPVIQPELVVRASTGPLPAHAEEGALSMPSYVVGVDFGTESGRAVVIDTADGRELGSSVYRYSNGVIDEHLPAPARRRPAGPEWALQDPDDYLRTFQPAIPAALAAAGVDPADVVGVGIDFTACTMLPTKRRWHALCDVPELRAEPHAWVKLWKHHAAQPEADRINAVARERGEPWLDTYGGKTRPSGSMPRRSRSSTRRRTSTLPPTGSSRRPTGSSGASPASRRATPARPATRPSGPSRTAFPGRDYFAALDPRFADIVDRRCRARSCPSARAPVT